MRVVLFVCPDNFPTLFQIPLGNTFLTLCVSIRAAAHRGRHTGPETEIWTLGESSLFPPLQMLN